jgi:hypothetical protein
VVVELAAYRDLEDDRVDLRNVRVGLREPLVEDATDLAIVLVGVIRCERLVDRRDIWRLGCGTPSVGVMYVTRLDCMHRPHAR